ncbi:fimbrial biogenesis chaperone [Paraburkholderia sp. HP33-1]|uniref:fimbrial biogenesis chaperone n=1 Tax=Paraburkholderia sp. HP33-1 TaxID=2883243 RepID=UPI001F401756|nr:fimbria/pilus periplasmic chaperone [Paraburkholderia sp. HP33-1]
MVALRSASSAGRIILAAAILALAGARTAESQQTTGGLMVEPVGVVFARGQTSAVLHIENQTGRDVAFQVRPYSWSQAGGVDQLTVTDELAVSPPIGHIRTGTKQVVRLVLRRPAEEQEAAYRILLDQVPPPRQPGTVNFAFRFSIPVFAEPAATAHAAPRVSWSLQPAGGEYYLVAVNRGTRHDEFSDIALTAADGRAIAIDESGSPYVLPGATRRWRILSKGFSPSGQTLRVTAHAESGPVDQPLAGP